MLDSSSLLYFLFAAISSLDQTKIYNSTKSNTTNKTHVT